MGTKMVKDIDLDALIADNEKSKKLPKGRELDGRKS